MRNTRNAMPMLPGFHLQTLRRKPRPAPADIRRRVLVEAGHRCAIPTCRYIEVDVHHIVPWSQCQAHDYDNLISLCPNCHRRADRGEIDRKSLRLYKSNLRFTHDKFSQVEVDLLFELARISDDMALIWPAHSLLLYKALARCRVCHTNQVASPHGY